MLITGEIQLGMESRRSEAESVLLRQIYTGFVRLKIDLDDLKQNETSHRMIDDSHELRLAMMTLDDIRERLLVCHELYKAYWYKGDLRHQIQEMVDRFED
jgi:hypothetical protein